MLPVSRILASRLLALLALLVSPWSTAFAESEKHDFFESRVRPLLSKHCYECHRRSAEGGLRLDSLDRIKQGGQTGPAIVVGDAEQSLLWKVISGNHDDIAMPPNGPLKTNEIKALKQWISDGAHWPTAKPSALATPDASGITEDERSFWSFQPIGNPTPPVVDGPWGKNPIDAFITTGHQQRGLTETSLAEPRALARRLSYDLTGLPPTSDELDAFENASSRDSKAAYTELVERLLASQHYGERWAQHWLDLVRYADTAGDASDFPIPEAYKYRNYVIDAFNNDKPFDQFAREQLAGDLMPTASEAETWERRIATGYLAISRRIGVSPSSQRHIMIEDTLNNLGKTFLGLSLGCARCHDHKFDPIPTADYYALYGIFDSTIYPHPGDEKKPYRANFVYRIGKEASDAELGPYREQLDTWRKKERAAFERYRAFQTMPINIPGYDREVAWRELGVIRDGLRQVATTFPDLETAFAVGEGNVGDSHIHKQGNPNSRGPVVRRGFLQVLGGQTIAKDSEQSGRLELANWIADRNNPLTARVIANRLWHHHFGRGLVSSTSDFGVRGDRPTHPKLLDFLARYLVDTGWSLKQLHRLIVSSRTYRLSSFHVSVSAATDPENHFFWRANRRRLDAEQLRDSILVFSDQLDPSVGQAHAFPHRLTYFYRQHEPFVGDFQNQRRTIYQFRQRIRKNRFLDLFDGPDGNLHLGNRYVTTTPLQSLYLMNSPFIEQ
ncbi:PSD1 and planctomycete cytochrome C domain-containing protein, partial [bacterium]|nr:PSD1 and planctomycete cytochrome C domain-containing protein [bacterium]